jgi:60 kDa SS-A/Ro ribonucleoprotein
MRKENSRKLLNFKEKKMGHTYLSTAAKAVVNPPQSKPLDSRQVPNSAGGFTYAVDDWKRLDRFLILGSEKGTYYVAEHELSVANIECVKRCVATDGIRTVERIVEISDSGRAPKNDPALLALAYAASKGDLATRTLALQSLPQVARIGTHLFHFIAFAKQFRGMGRGLRNAIVEWYAAKTPAQFAQQVTKYQQRDGWSHRDLLRLTHPKFAGTHQLIARWVVKGELEAENGDTIPQALIGHVAIQKATTPKEAAELIREFGVVRESVPTELLNSKEVWEALLEKMPLTAMIRNLGNMSKVGLLVPMSDASKLVASRLQDTEALRKSRVHPIQILLAAKTYEAGRGVKGSGTWTAVPKVVDALDEAYYGAFKNVEPTGKRFYLGLDISGSMWGNMIAGSFLDAATGSAAMAMVTVKTEENYYAAGFTAGKDRGYG